MYTYATQTVQRLKSKMVYTCISFGVSYVFPMGLEGTGKNAVCETWSHVGAPKFTTNVAKRTERTQMGQFLGRPCTRLRQGVEIAAKKHHFYAKQPTHLGVFFRDILQFVMLRFSFMF